MATNITVYPYLDPRIIEVKAPLKDISVQELINQIRAWEDSSIGMDYPFLIDAAGKEDLGGGVSVGITATLQNAQIAFEQRGSSDSNGAATSSDATGTILVDTLATFISDGIEAGDSVFNLTDNSIATVLRVDSETQLTHFKFQDGNNNDWTASDSYKIWNKVQCEISGGNLVAVDSLGASMSAFLPTALTHVIRTSSSSATATSQSLLEHSAFNNGVTIDISSPYTYDDDSTSIVVGTPKYPVNNLSDALLISVENGFNTLYVIGPLTLGSSDNVDNYIISGQNSNLTNITVLTGASTVGVTFIHLTMSGILDGGALIINSIISDVEYVDGIIQNTMIMDGTITLTGAGTLNILDSFSGVIGSSTPTIDFAGSGSALSLRNYNGGMLLTNKSGSDTVSIDLGSGQIKLDPNPVTGIIAGEIICRGVGKVIDSVTGDQIAPGTTSFNGSTVVNETVNPQSVAGQVWSEKISDNNVSGSFGEFVGSKLLTIAKFIGLK